jgi:hypothetical protein
MIRASGVAPVSQGNSVCTYAEVSAMDELVKLVVEKTGISEDMARTAVETVIGFLKEKLPAPIAGQIDAVLEGGGAANLVQGLGGILGR